MTPLERYQQDLLREDFREDSAQRQAVEHLQGLYEQLLAVKDQDEQGGLGRLKSIFSKKESVEPVKGLYFWGGVGRGKTYLMDVFFDCLPL